MYNSIVMWENRPTSDVIIIISLLDFQLQGPITRPSRRPTVWIQSLQDGKFHSQSHLQQPASTADAGRGDIDCGIGSFGYWIRQRLLFPRLSVHAGSGNSQRYPRFQHHNRTRIMDCFFVAPRSLLWRHSRRPSHEIWKEEHTCSCSFALRSFLVFYSFCLQRLHGLCFIFLVWNMLCRHITRHTSVHQWNCSPRDTRMPMLCGQTHS